MNLSPRRHRLIGRLGLFTAAIALSVSIVQAQQPNEFQVKAAYLYNFGRFTTWPAASLTSDAFSICILGRDPFGSVLDTAVNGERVAGKGVQVRRIENPQDAVSCQILFISSSEEGRLKNILAALGKSGVLTVSDISQFSRRGGMIGFILQDNKIRFEVNLTPADDAGLQLSSDLLKVAVTVRRNPQPGD